MKLASLNSGGVHITGAHRTNILWCRCIGRVYIYRHEGSVAVGEDMEGSKTVHSHA